MRLRMAATHMWGRSRARADPAVVASVEADLARLRREREDNADVNRMEESARMQPPY